MPQVPAVDEALTDLGERISLKLADKIIDQKLAFGELTISIKREALVGVIRFLHDDANLRFICLIDICAVDYPARVERFEVVYHLLSLKRNERIRIKLATDEATPVASITEIFPGANWHEREAYDFFGILFSGHPDLRRILTDYGFDGHPLRKDFPTTGYVEVRYDAERKRVVCDPVNLAQEMRSFDYLSPWEGCEYVLPGDEKADEKANG